MVQGILTSLKGLERQFVALRPLPTAVESHDCQFVVREGSESGDGARLLTSWARVLHIREVGVGTDRSSLSHLAVAPEVDLERQINKFTAPPNTRRIHPAWSGETFRAIRPHQHATSRLADRLTHTSNIPFKVVTTTAIGDSVWLSDDDGGDGNGNDDDDHDGWWWRWRWRWWPTITMSCQTPAAVQIQTYAWHRQPLTTPMAAASPHRVQTGLRTQYPYPVSIHTASIDGNSVPPERDAARAWFSYQAHVGGLGFRRVLARVRRLGRALRPGAHVVHRLNLEVPHLVVARVWHGVSADGRVWDRHRRPETVLRFSVRQQIPAPRSILFQSCEWLQTQHIHIDLFTHSFIWSFTHSCIHSYIEGVVNSLIYLSVSFTDLHPYRESVPWVHLRGVPCRIRTSHTMSSSSAFLGTPLRLSGYLEGATKEITRQLVSDCQKRTNSSPTAVISWWCYSSPLPPPPPPPPPHTHTHTHTPVISASNSLLFFRAVTSIFSQRLLHKVTNSRPVFTVHLHARKREDSPEKRNI